MERGFTAEQLGKLMDLFSRFDTNNDGSISGHELLVLLESLGHKSSDRQIKAFLKSVDTNNSGSIEFGEFVNMLAKKKALEPFQKMFREIDKNGDGYLSAAELRTALQQLDQNMTEADLAKFFNTADINGDGRVDFIEFAIAMVIAN